MHWLSKHRALVGFMGFVAVLAVAFAVVAFSIDQNKKAIRVGCTLLANAIIQSGGSAQANDTTAMFVTAIQRVMTPEEREKFKKSLAQNPPGKLVVPPCERIADHPDEVVAIPLRTPTPRPRPTPTRTPSPTP